MPDMTGGHGGEPVNRNVLVQEASLQAIADAIRAQNGTQDSYTPAQMAPAIEAIRTGAEPMEPHFFDLDTGYVYTDGWRIGGDTVNYSDVYRLEAGKAFLIALGDTVGTRFRATFTTQDTSVATSNVPGTSVVYQSNPAIYAYKTFMPEEDGYITITKDNAGVAGLKTFVYSGPSLANSNS